MEPIVSPLLIYLISVLGAIHIVASVLVFVVGIALFVLCVALLGSFADEERLRVRRYIKIVFILICVLCALIILIPSKETLYTIFNVMP